MENDNYSFSGWATRNDVKCSDGRIIMQDAFRGNDGGTVPLVWNHQHNDPSDVLGHALLENRPEGVYAYCSFNDTDSGKTAKTLVEHGDISALSIYANELQQKGDCVLHGIIREVSLVHAGANPKAFIENVMKHGSISEDEAYLYFDGDLELYHSNEPVEENEDPDQDPNENPEEHEETNEDSEQDTADPEADDGIEHSAMAHADGDKTVADVLKTFSDEQKAVFYALIYKALHMTPTENEGGNETMKHNIFDNEENQETTVLSHADQMEILELAKTSGTLKKGIKQFAANHTELAHGFEHIEQLFPEPHDLMPGAPEIIPEDKTWVSRWMNKTRKSPFNQLRTRQADIHAIRAGGYNEKGSKKTIMGNIELLERETGPQTVYIKEELHRDDVIDITDFSIVDYERKIMRSALDEELATASLIGDGRKSSDAQKIKEDHIRPVWTDDELYSIHTLIDMKKAKAEINGTGTAANFGEDYIRARAAIKAFRKARKQYKGSGALDCYMAPSLLTDMLMAVDMNGRFMYNTVEDLAKAFHVENIYEIDKFEGLTRQVTKEMQTKIYGLLAIFVNASDYDFGATRGGQVTSFDDFDIDFNMYKYLLETRCCGTLTRVKSAIVLEEDLTV